MQIPRVRLNDKPRNIVMDKIAKGWMVNYARKNFWRVSYYYEFDDLLQDGILCFYETVKRYPTANEPRHVMALFKLVFRSHVEKLAKKRTETVDQCFGDLLGENDTIQIDAVDDGLHAVAGLVINAPTSVKAVLGVFASDTGRHKLRAVYRKRPNGYRETVNDRLRRLTGLDGDLVTDVQRHFSQV